ncbi:MAG: TRAP transporter small permease [Desulfobacteraceae bacterium]|jgi:TRAP-type C4-dicarboxylate transport system permease small subunit
MAISIEKVDNALEHIEEAALACALFVCMSALFINVALRFIFNFILSFPDELARYLMIYIIYLGMSLGFKKQRQLKLDVLLNVFPGISRYIEILGDAVALFAAASIVVCGYQYTKELFISHEVSSVLQVPLYFLYGIAPLTALFMIFRLIRSVYKTARSR